MTDDSTSNFPAIRGRIIRLDENGLVCLNDIHSAAGYSKNQKPNDWRRLPFVTKLEFAVLERITGKSRNWTKDEMRSAIYAKTGQAGGTFADVRLALAYAEYLNPVLALEVREVFLRYKAGDVTLADEVLQKASPKDNEWAGTRALGRSTRAGYTATLQQHGVTKPVDYAICTNETYKGLFDKTAKQLKADKDVTKGGLRDAMSTKELAFVMAAEQLSVERIEEEECAGREECRQATGKSASFIRQAIEADRKDRRGRQQSLI